MKNARGKTVNRIVCKIGLCGFHQRFLIIGCLCWIRNGDALQFITSARRMFSNFSKNAFEYGLLFLDVFRHLSFFRSLCLAFVPYIISNLLLEYVVFLLKYMVL